MLKETCRPPYDPAGDTSSAFIPILIVFGRAASRVRNLPEVQAERVLDLLRNDPDAGIRKVTLKSVDRFRSPQLAGKQQQKAETDPEPFIRELAASTLKKVERRKK